MMSMQAVDMQQAPVKPEATLLAVFGASEFPEARSRFSPQPALEHAARSFEQLMMSTTWFGVPKNNSMYRFNSPHPPRELRKELHDFVGREGMRIENEGNQVINLVIYYAGHGGITHQGDYRLAVCATSMDDLEYTALSVPSLEVAPENLSCRLRRFLVLECCFARRALVDWVSRSGAANTVMLCACASGEVARVEEGECRLTSALIEVLKTGEETPAEHLSMLDLHRLVVDRLRREGVPPEGMPEIHCPGGAAAPLLGTRVFRNASQQVPTGGGVYQAYLEIFDGLPHARYCTDLDRKRALDVASKVSFGPEAAKQQRLSLRRISRILRDADYRYIVDFGSGYPTDDHLHSVARKGTIVYSDNDPRTCRVGIGMVEELRARGHDVYFFDADAAMPKPLLETLDEEGIVPRKEPTAYVYWGLSCFLTDEAIERAMRQLYQWAATGSMLVFQAQAHIAEDDTWVHTVRDAYAKMGVELKFRPLECYLELLGPWAVGADGFVPVLELLGIDKRLLSIPMQDFINGGGVGSGVFVQKVSGGTRVCNPDVKRYPTATRTAPDRRGLPERPFHINRD